MNPLPLVDAAEAPVPPGPQRLVLRELDLQRELAELRLRLLGPRVGHKLGLPESAKVKARLSIYRSCRAAPHVVYGRRSLWWTPEHVCLFFPAS